LPPGLPPLPSLPPVAVSPPVEVPPIDAPLDPTLPAIPVLPPLSPPAVLAPPTLPPLAFPAPADGSVEAPAAPACPEPADPFGPGEPSSEAPEQPLANDESNAPSRSPRRTLTVCIDRYKGSEIENRAAREKTRLQCQDARRCSRPHVRRAPILHSNLQVRVISIPSWYDR